MDELKNAKIDFLTKCYTRDSLVPVLRRLEQDYAKTKKPFSILLIDVDHFKLFNDKYGHLCGDEVLKYFASSMRLDLEVEENIPFRYGGDEFVVLFPNKVASEVFKLASRLRKNIKVRAFLYRGLQIHVSFSGGIASYPGDAKTFEDVIEKSDKAMYCSKKNGRGNVTLFGEIWFQKIKRILIFLDIVAVTLVILYMFKTPIVETSMRLFGGLQSVRVTMVPRESSSPLTSSPLPIAVAPVAPALSAPAPVVTVIEKKPDIIYLKSGGLLKGEIQSEDDHQVWIRLKLTNGEGSVAAKKSDIARIERGQ